MSLRGKRPSRQKSRVSDEQELLQKIRSVVWPPARAGKEKYGIRFGIGDDAALWSPRAGFETILTTDWFLEGTHFLRKLHPPESIGWKCLARATSDIAAMGGEPRCFLLSLALPENHTGKWLDEFLAGLRHASRKLRCPLIGGDTTQRNEILIHICVIGEVKKGRAVKRSGASAGDRIFVSGRLGEAELGLRLLRKMKQNAVGTNSLLRKHFYPEPRLGLGHWLSSNRIATAMMDVSDGLSTDLARLCKASRAGARIYANKLPQALEAFSRGFSAAERTEAALHGGDDYELLFCVANKKAANVPRTFSGIKLTDIGEITSKSGIKLIEPSGKTTPLFAGGWDRFRSTSSRT